MARSTSRRISEPRNIQVVLEYCPKLGETKFAGGRDLTVLTLLCHTGLAILNRLTEPEISEVLTARFEKPYRCSCVELVVESRQEQRGEVS